MSNPSRKNAITRREFVRIAGVTGVGLVISIALPGCAKTPEPTPTPTQTLVPPTATSSPTQVPPTQVPATKTLAPATATPTATPTPMPTPVPASWQPNIYATLDSNGTLTIKSFRSDLGQGANTALAMILAEELDADWSSVRLEHVGSNTAYGDQSTGGSASVRNHYDLLRKAGATARQLLVNAAAQKWSVEPGACRTEQSAVIHPDGKTKLSYGALVNDASKLDATKVSNVQLKNPANFKIIGTSRTLYQAPSMVRGDPVFAMDVRLPGMLYAVIVRCPVVGGKAASFDGSKASAVPGVRRVVKVGNNVADNTWAAMRGRDALQVTWNEGGFANLTSASIRDEQVKAAPSLDGGSAQLVKAAYDIPYLAIAAMEPMNCTADVKSDRCEVWAPTQTAQSVSRAVQSITRLPETAITVHVPPAGGAFGGRHATDHVSDAVQLSITMNAPVKVMWTRSDDIQCTGYHPLSYNYVEATLNNTGVPTKLPSNQSFSPKSGIRTGSWRAVGNFTDAFARESFLDEVAAKSKIDPLALRLKLVPTQGQKVLQLAADKSDWGKPLPEGQGRGIAYWALWGSTHVAQVVHVIVAADGTIRVPRVVCAVDCGQIINPDTVAQQIEGAIVFALTPALKSSITIDKGRVQQHGFADHPLITMAEAPLVEVYTIPGTGRAPTGIGEAGVPPLVPALANAVFAATGIRVRHMPIRPEDLKRK